MNINYQPATMGLNWRVEALKLKINNNTVNLRDFVVLSAGFWYKVRPFSDRKVKQRQRSAMSPDAIRLFRTLIAS